MTSLILVLAIAVAVAVVLLTVGVVLLIKLGVIARYALKPDEPPAPRDYDLDQSSPAGRSS